MKRLVVFLIAALFASAAHAQNAQFRYDGRYHTYAGVNPTSGAVALFSNNPNSWLDIGRYAFGWTIMTPHTLEIHPSDFSVSCYSAGCLPRFQVRNVGDSAAAIWINGNNKIGSQFGPIIFTFGSFNGGDTEVGRFDTTGNLVLLQDLIIENASLKDRLAAIEARLSALEGE